MRSRYILLALALLIAPTAFAQDTGSSNDADAVRAVIDRLFDGMRAGDSTAVRSVFYPGATLGTAYTAPDGTPQYASNPADRFVEAVGTLHDVVWDERIWDVEIAVDGRMAVAWVPYAFFLGETMSHCGANSIQFFYGPDGWQMVRLMDTRHRATCAEFVPESVMRGE